MVVHGKALRDCDLNGERNSIGSMNSDNGRDLIHFERWRVLQAWGRILSLSQVSGLRVSS